MHPGGEIAAAKAAGDAGTVYILSTISGHKLENVKAATKGPAWYQLYLLGGRAAAESGIDRARRAGFSALVITVDTPVAGMRERDPRNGMKQLLGSSLFAKLPFFPQFLAHPRWLAAFSPTAESQARKHHCSRGRPHATGGRRGRPRRRRRNVERFELDKKVWPGPIIVKGLLTGDDARRAVDEGVAAVIVSNHGGANSIPSIPQFGRSPKSSPPSTAAQKSDGWRNPPRQ